MQKVFVPERFAGLQPEAARWQRTWVEFLKKDGNYVVTIRSILTNIEVRMPAGIAESAFIETCYKYGTEAASAQITDMTVEVSRSEITIDEQTSSGVYGFFEIGNVKFSDDLSTFEHRIIDGKVTFTAAEVAGLFWKKVNDGWFDLIRVLMLESIGAGDDELDAD